MVVQNNNVCSIFSFIIFLHFLPSSSFGSYSNFNCNAINAGHFCLCSQGEPGSWDIQCPARILEVYPVSLKLVMSPLDPEEASLRVICDPNKSHFGWRVVQGVDFARENFSIANLDISYCPPITTIDLENFLHQMRLDPEDVHTFSYQTWQENTTLPSDFLRLMPNLEVVDLRNNKLPTLVNFQGLPFLNQINLRGNRIRTIPNGTFSSNSHLEQIHLGGNLLSKITKEMFPPSLLYLDLVDNEITRISNNSLSRLVNLQVLYLNNNPLGRVETGAFSHLKNLTELSLDNSRLYSLPLLTDLPKLTNLSISYSLFTSTNQLITTTLSPEELSSIGNDEQEMTTENKNFFVTSATTTPTSATIENSTELTTPTAASTGVDKATDDEAEKLIRIGDLYALRKLVLINDDLKTGSLSLFGYLPNLTDLMLAQNDIDALPKRFFRKMPALAYADLSKNSVVTLNEIDAPLLSYLDLGNNFVKSIDQSVFRQLKQLRFLSLASNKIEHIHPNAFEHLESLMVLDLSNNKITFERSLPSPSPTIMDAIASALQEGTSGGSSVEDDMIDSPNQSPLRYLRKIERINLRNNLIRKFFIDWTFVPLWLKTLDLSHNKIKSLHPRDMHFISSDVRLDLRYNEITEVDMDFADLLLDRVENKNVVVSLDGNPLHCDCHVIAFKRFAVKSYQLRYTDLKCATPENLKGRRFTEVSVRELRCMVTQSCPQDCTCWEVPTENLIRMECSNLNFLSHQNQDEELFKNFADTYDPLELELDLSGQKISPLNGSIFSGMTPQFRLVNLTDSGLSDLEFLDSVPTSNNVTKFALSKNAFKCDGCNFQKRWWQHFKRIVDIRSITCFMPGGVEILTFPDIVRGTLCNEDSISEEIRLTVILLAIIIPVIIATIICLTRLRSHKNKGRGRKRKGVNKAVKVESIIGVGGTLRSVAPPPPQIRRQQRAYTSTRSKVVDMDNSRF